MHAIRVIFPHKKYMRSFSKEKIQGSNTVTEVMGKVTKHEKMAQMATCREYKFEQVDSHGISRKGHGKVTEK